MKKILFALTICAFALGNAQETPKKSCCSDKAKKECSAKEKKECSEKDKKECSKKNATQKLKTRKKLVVQQRKKQLKNKNTEISVFFYGFL